MNGGKHMKKERITLNLQLFDGDGAGTGTGTGTATGDNGNAPAAGENVANVKYGIQDNEAQAAAVSETQVVEKTAEQRKAEFEKLISGEYKDLFGERTQSIIDKRFKETKALETQVTSINPVLEMLASKYGVDASDIENLSKAIQEDESFYEDEAAEKGLSVEQLKAIKKMERENVELRKAVEARESQEKASQIYSQWMQQGEELQQVYPSFSLENEVQNEQFTSLLRNGIDVKTAYEVIHKDEIIGGAMQYTAQQVRKQVVSDIQARGNRPAENGLSQVAPALVKKDVNQLTKKDREEIEKRVLRGEKIRF
jgi:hypothetical protein